MLYRGMDRAQLDATYNNTAAVPERDAMPVAEVRGGIAISGIFDLEPIRLNYLNEKQGLDTAEAAQGAFGVYDMVREDTSRLDKA